MPPSVSDNAAETFPKSNMSEVIPLRFEIETLSGNRHDIELNWDKSSAPGQLLDESKSYKNGGSVELLSISSDQANSKLPEALADAKLDLSKESGQALLKTLRKRLREVDLEARVGSSSQDEDNTEGIANYKANALLLDENNNELDDVALIKMATSAGSNVSAKISLRYRLRHYPVYADLFELLKFRPIIRWALEILLVSISALFLAACAQASFNLPKSWSDQIGQKTQVPITFQTFAVLFTAVLLGKWRGFFSSALYLLFILAGAPFGALQSGGYHILYYSSAGYLWSYPITSFVVGWLAERGWDRQWRWCILAMTIGNFIIYAIGLLYLPFGLMEATGLSTDTLWCGAPHGCVGNVMYAGLIPFIPGDAIKIGMACALLPVGWKTLPFIARMYSKYIVKSKKEEIQTEKDNNAMNKIEVDKEMSVQNNQNVMFHFGRTGEADELVHNSIE